MNIRKAEESDVSEIVKLHLYLIKHLIDCKSYRFSLKKGEAERYKEKILEDFDKLDAEVLVAENDGVIVGFAIGIINDYPPFLKLKRYGLIEEVVVHKVHQRKGIGSELCNELIVFFKGKSLKFVELLVDACNDPAVGAWNKLGFKEEYRSMGKAI